MIERLQHGKLRIGEIADRLTLYEPRQQGVRTARQFDECVQRAHLCTCSDIVGRHSQIPFTSNSLMSKYYIKRKSLSRRRIPGRSTSSFEMFTITGTWPGSLR